MLAELAMGPIDSANFYRIFLEILYFQITRGRKYLLPKCYRSCGNRPYFILNGLKYATRGRRSRHNNLTCLHFWSLYTCYLTNSACMSCLKLTRYMWNKKCVCLLLYYIFVCLLYYVGRLRTYSLFPYYIRRHYNILDT